MHNMLCTPSAVSQAGAPSSALPTGPHCDATLKGWTGRRSTGAPLVLHLAFYFCGNSPEDAFGLGLMLRHINTAAQARWVLFHNIGHRHSVNFRQNSGFLAGQRRRGARRKNSDSCRCDSCRCCCGKQPRPRHSSLSSLETSRGCAPLYFITR